MRFCTNRSPIFVWLSGCVCLALAGCGTHEPAAPDPDGHGEAESEGVHKGAHGGRLLTDGDLTLELAIVETGVPPEFRAWVIKGGAPVPPGDVDLTVTLTRLGGVTDNIGFEPQDDFLRGDTVVYEPHSFVVDIKARHRGALHRWQYDNFEGRTRIAADVAHAFGLETENAGPATINETVNVYGRVVANAERVRSITARFEGVIGAVNVSVGTSVEAGDPLVTVESDASLKSYTITAPMAGMVTERLANPGEHTAGRTLITIVDASTVWVELAVFPAERAQVVVGAPVVITAVAGELERTGRIDRFNPVAEPNQSVLARVVLDNADRALMPGMFVAGRIQVAQQRVPLAVRRSGLQSFRDFTVVYAQIGDEYEVRMLDLGRQGDVWVEVLGGLEAGTRYVTANSYLVKADIEKAGAAHDH